MSVTTQAVASGLFLIMSLILLFRAGQGVARTVLLLAAGVLSVLMLIAFFVADYFTAEGINEAVVYHMTYGLDGAGFAEYANVMVFGSIAVLLLFVSLAWVFLKLRRQQRNLTLHKRPGFDTRGAAALLSMALSLAINPAAADIYHLVAPSGLPPLAGDAPKEPGMQDPADDFAKHYSNAGITGTDRPPRNLVYIYAESLEQNYFDEALFPGLMRNLRTLQREATSFTGIEQVPGTGWTIAGMVASQCGIPLFTPSHGNAMEGLQNFLPAAICLGDLLKPAGYHLAYMGGAKLKFAGKGNFYQTHRFDEVSGRDELIGVLPDPAYLNPWGLYDDSLLGLAFEKYSTLSASGKPFGLFLLTLDTHHPDGHASRQCDGEKYADGSNPMLNAVHCADILLSQFIRRIRASPGGKDTVVVLASDHLAMKNLAYDQLEKKPRRNFMAVWEPGQSKGRIIDTEGSALDIAPTVLGYLGYQGRVGLGSSLLDRGQEQADRAAYIRTSLERWRAPLGRFWGFPAITHHVKVDVPARQMEIDGQVMRIPALIELDDRLQTQVKFPYLESPAELVGRNPPDKGFLLFADCATRNAGLPAGEYCLFAGRGSIIQNQMLIRHEVRYSPEAVRRMAGMAP